MYLSPEKELYSIIQQFYSGKFAELTELDLNIEYDFSNILYNFEAQFYKIRSFLILKDYTNAVKLLNDLSGQVAQNESSIDAESYAFLMKDIGVLKSYVQFQETGAVDEELLHIVDNKKPSLALLYKKIILNNTPVDVESPDLDLEAYLLLLFYSTNSPSLTNSTNDINVQEIENLKSHFNDCLIIDFVVAWLGLISPSHANSEDSAINLKNSYYFFDELSSSSNTESHKNLINLLACQLKLGNISESLDILNKLNESTSNSTYEYSLLINKICFNSINLNADERSNLIAEVKQKFPNSNYVKDLNEKEHLFDSMVATFQ